MTGAHRFSVAPMMDWTDRHCRYFHRQISRHARLYTEMLTADAVIHGDLERLLTFDPAEHPLALQLGGSEPDKMARAAWIAADWGYDEININVGCPSDRVQKGRFGACLMAEPETVAACFSAMQSAVDVPVTVKCRIGIDDQNRFEDLVRFVEPVRTAGCRVFIVHARNAILAGLSPKQNRDIPPLKYQFVHRLKETFPELTVVLNGGLRGVVETAVRLDHLDGAMFGREAYQNPYCLVDVDHAFFEDPSPIPSRHEVVGSMLDYVERQCRAGWRLNAVTRHMIGLFQGQPGARAWRRYLSENAHKPGAGPEVLLAAAALVPDRDAADSAA